MSLSGLLRVITDDPQLRRALEIAGGETGPGVSPGTAGVDLIGPPALRGVLAAALTAHGATAQDGAGHDGAVQGESGQRAAGQDGAGRFVLAVTATAREAEDLTAALSSLLPPDSVAYFPAWETLPHERLSPRSDTSG